MTQGASHRMAALTPPLTAASKRPDCSDDGHGTLALYISENRYGLRALKSPSCGYISQSQYCAFSLAMEIGRDEGKDPSILRQIEVRIERGCGTPRQ